MNKKAFTFIQGAIIALIILVIMLSGVLSKIPTLYKNFIRSLPKASLTENAYFKAESVGITDYALANKGCDVSQKSQNILLDCPSNLKLKFFVNIKNFLWILQTLA